MSCGGSHESNANAATISDAVKSTNALMTQLADGGWDEDGDSLFKEFDHSLGGYSASVEPTETGYQARILMTYRDYEGTQTEDVDTRNFSTSDEAREWVDTWESDALQTQAVEDSAAMEEEFNRQTSNPLSVVDMDIE